MTKAHKTVEGLNTVRVLDRIPVIKQIGSMELLHQLIVDQSIDVMAIRSYLLHGSEEHVL